MKQRAKFVMFMLSAAVLAGAWLVAGYMDGLSQTAEGAGPDATAEPIPLSVGSREALTALSWSWEGRTVNLARDEATGRWIDADDPDCPIDAGTAEALARAAASTAASMAVENVTDLSQYGLETAQLTVIAAASDAFTTYEVGNMSVTGEYYTRVNGENTVYLENGSLAAFRVGRADLLALETAPDDVAAVTGLAVTSDAGDYEIEYLSGSGEEGWFRTDGDMSVALEEEAVLPLAEALLETDLTRCVGWAAGDAARYGLDEPQMTAELRYSDAAGNGKSFTLNFGDYEGSDIYVSFAGSDIVYLTSALGPDGLMYPDWDRLTPAPVLTLDTGDIASVLLEAGGTEYEVLRLEEETERAVGDGSVTVTDVIYSCGGFVLDTKQVESWLRDLAGLTAAGSATGGGRETLLRLTITWKDAEAIPAEVELRSYDSGRCLCVLGGDRYLLVSRAAAEAVIDRAESVFTHT